MKCVGLIALLVATTHSPAPADAATREQGEVPPYSPALEAQVQSRCLVNCSVAPFVVTYEKNDRVLVFVASRHAFDPKSSSFRAVEAAFAATAPGIVIVEGFPTQMGENPPQLVEQASQVGTDTGNTFTRGEAMYAITHALARRVPFLGGEPTRAQQVQALGGKGFQPADIAFSYLLGGVAQSVRSGNLRDTSDPKLKDEFGYWQNAFAEQYQLQPLSFGEFVERYRKTFGVELKLDRDITTRPDPGISSPVAKLNRADMVTRDEHLLATIDQQLALKKRVLVVYGSSHWTTLSQALEKRLGKPMIRPVPDAEPRRH